MRTVLLIDDDTILRAVCRRALEKEGFRVSEAADGAEGLAAYLLEPADVVLCDLFMPERDGMSIIGELCRARPGTRVVAMSGGGRWLPPERLLEVAAALGAVGAVTKPFSHAQLLAAIRGALAACPTA
jgi:CheY-like chemotaxis protein